MRPKVHTASKLAVEPVVDIRADEVRKPPFRMRMHGQHVLVAQRKNSGTSHIEPVRLASPVHINPRYSHCTRSGDR